MTKPFVPLETPVMPLIPELQIVRLTNENEQLKTKIQALEEIIGFYRSTLDRHEMDQRLGALISKAEIAKLTVPTSA